MTHTTWGETDTAVYQISKYLSSSRITSKVIIDVDVWLVQSICQQYREKKPSKVHRIEHVHPDPDFKLDLDMAEAIWTIFEGLKNMLEKCSQSNAISFGKDMEKAIKRDHPGLVESHEHANAIWWWVRLKKRCFGDGSGGFAIFATRDLVEGEILYPLMGLMASDSRAEHSRLSEIHPHPSQVKLEKGRMDPRVLVGPLRFINHTCHSFNAEFVAIRSALAFVVQTNKLIKFHDEVFVDYGKDYFEDIEKCRAGTAVGIRKVQALRVQKSPHLGLRGRLKNVGGCIKRGVEIKS
ncbi:uncharacterized protein LACBIDRAFT_310701 [Laccaria bicolor S238N-H82]|uniref:Predicted protein n=1 Tax=Laccaria bicolor (strain S238N-H82 / ATCC MYA-4686) TaxID=486041 RepID=B0DUX4_LACBS|nr:uncharacterized protein LACBIDRAFT_310701 [Laccaria bicolor S238N-H82]EDR01622.1 predicted protein [Laccaria bicolor S238N-H82]|eukprot:XP_001887698.1 predicted protein [Laccaria bicolor S238N-H82]